MRSPNPTSSSASRAHLDGSDGVDGAGSFHHCANVSAVHLGREILRLLIALELKGSEDGDGHNHQTRDQPMAPEHVHDVILALPTVSVARFMIIQANHINPELQVRLRIESLAR
jgi:hypothetical protein